MRKVLIIFLILFLGLPSFSYDEELLKFFSKEYLDEYFSHNWQGSNDIIDNWNGSNIIEGPGFNSYYPPGTIIYPFRTKEEQARADAHNATIKESFEADDKALEELKRNGNNKVKVIIQNKK